MSDLQSFDVVIIGAGHNGLTCAAYLAAAGLETLALEQNDLVGGAAVTEEFHPGFRNSVAAYTVSLLNPKVITDLELSYKIVENVKASIGANNLFNKYPDKLNPDYRQTFLVGNANGYVTQYPTFSSFGINGGYWYGKIAIEF